MDFQLWIFTTVDVQKSIIESIKSTIKSGSQKVSVKHLLDILRVHYWYEKLEECCSSPSDDKGNKVNNL